MRRATVEHVSAAIARLIGWYALAVGEAEDAHAQRTLAVVLGERSGSVLRMSRVDVLVGGLVAVGARHSRLLDMSIARHLGESAQHIHHVGIWEHLLAQLQQRAEVVHSRRNGIDEVLLALKVAAETVCAEHLQRAEEYEEAQTVYEVAQRRHLGVLLQRVVVFGYEFAAQLVAVACRRLP